MSLLCQHRTERWIQVPYTNTTRPSNHNSGLTNKLIGARMDSWANLASTRRRAWNQSAETVRPFHYDIADKGYARLYVIAESRS